MADLENKVILITGGASGLGESAVRTAAQHGARVAIVDYNLEAAEALAAEIDGAKAYHADVSKPEDMNAAVAAVVADYGQLDGAVNNAGIAPPGFAQPHEWDDEGWDRTLAVNLNGVFYSARAELKQFLAQGHGTMVNTASLAGLLADFGTMPYIVAKHGVVGLTKSIALEYGRAGIRCNAVCPSYVLTPMTEVPFQDPEFKKMLSLRTPMGRAVTAQEVADAMVFLLSDRSGGVTGETFKIDGGVAVM